MSAANPYVAPHEHGRKAYKRAKLEHRQNKALHRTRKNIAKRRKAAARFLDTPEGVVFTYAFIVIVGTLLALTVIYT